MSVDAIRTKSERRIVIWAYALWTQGLDTVDIANRLGVSEAEVANALARWRGSAAR